MKYIKEIIEKDSPTLEELLSCFEKIKLNGNVVVIKLDGERVTDEYTVFISFPKINREMLRVDDNDLKIALLKVLNLYLIAER